MKVAIIGAGINGLYLSWKLALKGHSVTVFEKKSEVGNDVCSGLFSNRLLEYFPESEKLVEKKIDSIVIHFNDKKKTEIKFSKEFLLMSHYDLDKQAFQKAKEAGVNFVFNSDITEIPGFERIIGCDGGNSIVRRKLKLQEPDFRLGIIGFCKKQGEIIEIWPVKSGFIWKIPRKNETEYGIIAKPVESGKLFNKFLKENNIEIKDLKSKVIPQGLIIPDNKIITLCGDAAGLTKPWSGGGVIWGLKAGDMLLNNFPDFKKYKKEAESFFSKKIFISKLAVKMVDIAGNKFAWLIPGHAKIESDFLF